VSGTVRAAAETLERRVGNDAVAVREVLDARNGCELFTLRMLRAVRGHGIARPTGDSEELLFTLSGHGTLLAGDGEHALEPESGALMRPGESYELLNEGPADLVVVSVALHEPLASSALAGRRISRLVDARAQAATAAREFRIVFDPDCGCATATQFVGYIPPGAAPRHFHLYDEVIYVLEGEGVMHMGDEHTPVRAGSCIHLPARELHTLENGGSAVMRVLGTFRPAGSPAAAFYPDGTPAYTEQPQAAAAGT
jgi:mannose-6-phosphate isomerase-like protein (cupin superfamily)